MDPRVRDLYKRFMIAGRSYPEGLAYVRDKVKEGFRKHQHVADEVLLSSWNILLDFFHETVLFFIGRAKEMYCVWKIPSA